MKKDVIISIKGMQKYEGAAPDVVELVTKGQLTGDGENYVITYMESELTGLEGTQTTIFTEGERVTLLRQGGVNSQMVFQEGRRHMSMYNTPYGALEVGINTLSLFTELNDLGGEIEIDYAIEVDHAVTGRNTFQIKVREDQSPELPR